MAMNNNIFTIALFFYNDETPEEGTMQIIEGKARGAMRRLRIDEQKT